ncbi:FecR protein [Planctomycetes bacterium CA13]|uniref:FecR protein n=1 Tax=Novipirellula herctigrandis TaxID=2527986 RepID=A0A5C5ZBP9_9BACT|nr:FecR protein [Planctomycetes bacterium CA13]
MNSNGQPNHDTFELVSAYRDGTISPVQQEHLQRLLLSDASAREYFLRFMTLEALLEARFPVSQPNLPVSQPNREEAPITLLPETVGRSSRSKRWKPVMAVAATLLFVVSGVVWQTGHEKVPSIALVADLTDVSWAPGHQSLNVGDKVPPSRIRLRHGIVRLSYQHGVAVTIQGPADYEIRTLDNAVLHHGRMAAYVPDGAEGFSVSTPNANVVDLGTEFGLTVSNDGETELSVFDGKVQLTSSAENDSQIVLAGLAVRVDKAGRMRHEPIHLAPYRDARDSLFRQRMVWEPFGPGSGQEFPGRKGRGWQDAWAIQTRAGSIIENETGVFSEPTLFPGTEFFLGIAAAADNSTESCQVRVARSFGSVDRFSTNEPFTVELLLRLDCEPQDVKSIRLIGAEDNSTASNLPLWEFEAAQIWQAGSEHLAWQFRPSSSKHTEPLTLRVLQGVSIRCFIEIDPLMNQCRATISNRRVSISMKQANESSQSFASDGPVRLAFEVIGQEGKDVRFSMDAIRIQNRPTATQ